jgi:hypothetical protein
MADSVLYFPAIRVPQTEWFTRVLLYWDKIGTIVPFEYVDDPDFLRPFTADLLAAGLVSPVTPDAWMQQMGADNYMQSFLDLVEADPELITGAPLERRETVRIHSEKTGTGLAQALVSLGLARHVGGPEWSSWFDIEKVTGNLLMAFLASILAQREDEPMDPITDSTDCLAAFTRLPPHQTNGVVAATDSIRMAFLNDILPAPVGRIEPADLADFKSSHEKLLVGFRNEIEQRVVAAAAIDDARLQARQLELSRRDLQNQLEEITARMNERDWSRLALGGLGGVVAGALMLADATVTGGVLTLAGSSLGLTTAVYSAFGGRRSKEQILGRPLAFAALAQQASAQAKPFSHRATPLSKLMSFARR